MKKVVRDLGKLARLMDEERAALREADMARISQIGPRKLALIDRIEGYPPADLPPDAVALGGRIAESARRNQLLIAAALDGLRDAQQLLTRARLPRRHETYARDGMRQKIGTAPGQLEKRA